MGGQCLRDGACHVARRVSSPIRVHKSGGLGSLLTSAPADTTGTHRDAKAPRGRAIHTMEFSTSARGGQADHSARARPHSGGIAGNDQRSPVAPGLMHQLHGPGGYDWVPSAPPHERHPWRAEPARLCGTRDSGPIVSTLWPCNSEPTVPFPLCQVSLTLHDAIPIVAGCTGLAPWLLASMSPHLPLLLGSLSVSGSVVKSV